MKNGDIIEDKVNSYIEKNFATNDVAKKIWKKALSKCIICKLLDYKFKNL